MPDRKRLFQVGRRKVKGHKVNMCFTLVSPRPYVKKNSFRTETQYYSLKAMEG